MLRIIHILILIKKSNDKDAKFKVGDDVRILKNKNIFLKGYTQNWSGEILVNKKVKNTVIMDIFY